MESYKRLGQIVIVFPGHTKFNARFPADNNKVMQYNFDELIDNTYGLENDLKYPYIYDRFVFLKEMEIEIIFHIKDKKYKQNPNQKEEELII